MEKNIERKTLSFSKGMTNVPSDLLSGDSELVESEGFIYKDGEMKPIQTPSPLEGTVEGKLMYVHKGADYENLICYKDSTIYIYKKNGSTVTFLQKATQEGITSVSSVKNTLVCPTNTGVYYFLYKAGKYEVLGKDLPKPSILVRINSEEDYHVGDVTNISLLDLAGGVTYTIFCDSTGKMVGRGVYNDISSDAYAIWGKCKDDSGKYVLENRVNIHFCPFDNNLSTDIYDAIQAKIQGHVSAVINAIKKAKRFAFPFFIRLALKLYDGSYARITNPILCYPTITRNNDIIPVWWNESEAKWEKCTYQNGGGETYNFFYFPFHGYMTFQLNMSTGYEKWKDLIDKVVIFATPQVLPFKLEEKWAYRWAEEVDGNMYADGINQTNADHWYKKYNMGVGDGMDYPTAHICPTKWKTESEMIEELLTKSQFYKLMEFDFMSPPGGYMGYYNSMTSPSTEKYLKDGVLENLEEQEQLPNDDYYGWTTMVPSVTFPYNGRLNAFNTKRFPFKGFKYFSAGDDTFNVQYLVDGQLVGASSPALVYYVHIESDTMNAWVASDRITPNVPLGGWFYYPDPNATEIIIYEVGTQRYSRYALHKHKMLNGAYSFEHLPDTTDTNYQMLQFESQGEPPTVDETAHETFDSNIYTSEANNPFVFTAAGDNTVGTGRILGVAANTVAVSQGQFGQYPLLVFTSEGIYSMGMNTEGVFTSVHPISREVPNDNSPFVPTDNQIIFTSKKGLMAATGSQVTCLSEQMKGRNARNFSSLTAKTFKEILEDCMIAYDYNDSILRICTKDSTKQIIYNMKDGTFAIKDEGLIAQNIVNDYPDNLIQDQDGALYSLELKPNINEDTSKYSGAVVTRPLKLGGSVTLKSLRAVKNLLDTDNGKIKLTIYGSNDCKHWQKITSLNGKPWKYFTFSYALSDFSATDSFAGSIVEVQSRREDKLR